MRLRHKQCHMLVFGMLLMSADAFEGAATTTKHSTNGASCIRCHTLAAQSCVRDMPPSPTCATRHPGTWLRSRSRSFSPRGTADSALQLLDVNPINTPMASGALHAVCTHTWNGAGFICTTHARPLFLSSATHTWLCPPDFSVQVGLGLGTALDDVLGVIVAQHFLAEVRLNLCCERVPGSKVLHTRPPPPRKMCKRCEHVQFLRCAQHVVCTASHVAV